MSNTDNAYTGCPVQYARQFLAGKWQMGILWNLKDKPLRFNEIKNLLPGISDKILMEELDAFVQKAIINRNTHEFPSPKTEYQLSIVGQSLIPVITTIVEWGYVHLQDERVNKEMNITPLSAIQAIEVGMTEME